MRRPVAPTLALLLAAALVPVPPGPAGALPDSTGTTTRVSVRSGGGQAEAQGPAAAGQPAVSGDGASVAFASDAANLVGGNRNGESDVFVSQDRKSVV
jgi:hypothetical protein